METTRNQEKLLFTPREVRWCFIIYKLLCETNGTLFCWWTVIEDETGRVQSCGSLAQIRVTGTVFKIGLPCSFNAILVYMTCIFIKEIVTCNLLTSILQIDFFARDEHITIIPNFSLPTRDTRVPCIMVCWVYVSMANIRMDVYACHSSTVTHR